MEKKWSIIEELVNNCKLNLLVSSPAGSGKTQKLTDRYISILQSQYDQKHAIEPERIVAITFTKKAAAEMKERILKELKNHPEIHRMFSARINKVRISTIDSFFLSLYRQFALEADENPQVTVLDENQQKELVDRLYHQFVFEKFRRTENVADELSYFLALFGWNNVKELVQNAVSLRNKLDRLIATGNSGEKLDFDTIAKEYAGLLRNKIKDPYKELKIAHGDTFKKGIMVIVNHLVELYDRIKDEQGKIDYNDIEFRLFKLLKNNLVNLNLLYDFDKQFDYLLVDEFQDTNFIQWYIIAKLTEEWFSGFGAKQSSGKIPSVFFVGDPKQSIYMFRGANVEVMNIASQEFKKRKNIPEFAKQFEIVTEKRNFRSQSSIIEFVNTVFLKIMGQQVQDQLAWKVNYELFECAAEKKDGGNVEVALFQSQEKMNVQHLAQIESQIVAQKIIQLINAGARFSDIAILLKSRTHLDAFEEGLLSANIPFKVYKGKGFFAEKEIQILLALIKFLYNPEDEISLYAILRSPLYGLSDDDLVAISQISNQTKFDALKSFSYSIYQELNEYIGLYKWEHTYLVINKFLNNKERYKYFSERQRYANVIKFLNLLEEMEYSSEDKLEINKALAYMEEKGDLEKANIIDESFDSVTLLTVHAAKGLEYPYAFVVQLTAGESKKFEQLVAYELVKPADSLRLDTEYCVFPVKGESITLEEYIERKLEESKRLFYVACTRAKDKLFLTGAFHKQIDKTSWLGLLTAHEIIHRNKDSMELDKQLAGVAKLEVMAEAPETISLLRKSPSMKVFVDKPVHSAYAFVSRLPSQIGALQYPVSDTIASRTIGDIIHALLDKFTRRKLSESDLENEALALLKYQPDPESLKEELLNYIQAIRQHKIIELAAPAPNKFSEFPFIYKKGNELWRGKIDLLVIHDDRIIIYDYKTSRLSPEELIASFRGQLSLYAEAISTIWPNKKVEAFLFQIPTGDCIKI